MAGVQNLSNLEGPI